MRPEPEEPLAGPPPLWSQQPLSSAQRPRLILLGVLMAALGVAAILLPFWSEIAVALLLGFVFMGAGMLDAAHAFLLEKRTFVLSWFAAAVFFLAGLILALSEAVDVLFGASAGMTALPLMLGLVFWIGGGLRMGKGHNLRAYPHWRWIFASGLLGLIFGTLILFQWRAIGLETITLLAGLSLAADGLARMVFASGLGREAQG